MTIIAGTEKAERINGPALEASFKFLREIIVDQRDGSLFILDGQLIRKLSPEGMCTLC